MVTLKLGLPETLPCSTRYAGAAARNVIREGKHERVIAPTAATFRAEISVKQVNIEVSRAAMRPRII